MNKRQLATVLAALRFWQINNMPEGAATYKAMVDRGAARDDALLDIASDGGTVEALAQEEIDELCDTFNIADSHRRKRS